MQIWSNKGRCVYEKPIERPVKRWNLINNQLLYMVDDTKLIAIECGETKYDTVVRNFVIVEKEDSSRMSLLKNIFNKNQT